MTQPGRLDEQPVRAGFAQQSAQAHLERHAIDAAQAATFDFADGDAVFVTAE
ncbi:hypothetical protein D3C77_679050 [compost metagenome]